MSDNETLVTLPSGGRAWVATLMTHAQDQALYRHWLRLSRFETEVRVEGSDEKQRVQRTDLTPAEFEELLDLQLQTREVHIRTCVRRWEGVTDPDGQALAFPDDVGRMRSADFDELFRAVSAVRRGEELPNSTGPSPAS